MAGKIINCNCQHTEQDKLHGKNKRVANQMVTKAGQSKYRCTVCLREHIQ